MTDPPTPNNAKDAFETASNRTDTPLCIKRINLHRPLSNTGFLTTIMFTADAFLLPLLAFIGTFALWTLLPFMGAAMAALWSFIRRNDQDGTLAGEPTLCPDLITVHRKNPRKADQYWTATPYRVTVHMKNTSKIETCLTLKGAGREIEPGAFSTSDERKDLHRDLRAKPADVSGMAPC